MDMTDQIVQRRSLEWYVGKAVYITPEYAQHIQWTPGYYRVINASLDSNTWAVESLPGMPDEPVYVHDGSRDLKAIPSTVRPPVYEFVLWWVGYLVCVIGMGVVAVNGTLFWALIFLPLLAGPFYSWFVNIEPVRGTKTSLAIFGAQGALAVKQHHDRGEMARINERLGIK